MPLKSDRWNQFNPTPHPWELEALNFLREQLQDVEPNRVFALFEFASHDGYIGEVDALVLTYKGFFLVEIKSRPGRITGDTATWTWHTPEGKRQTVDSPIFATNRKCKRLSDLLKRQKALREHQLPFLHPLVFLSATDMRVEIDESARQFVCTRSGSPGTESLLQALTQLTPAERSDGRRRVIDAPLARAITQALAQAGIRPSVSHKRFANSYELDSLLLEGPGYQDWLAHHVTSTKVQRRVRTYPVATTVDIPTRQMLARAARREFVLLQGVNHQGILRALEFQEGDQGPGLVFDYDPDDVRLDHFVRDEGTKLNLTDRLSILRQIAEAMQHAHDQRLVHRALSPQSVLIRRLPKGGFSTRIYNWQTASRDATTGATSSSGSITLTQHLDSLIDPTALPYLAPETQADPTARAEHLDVFGLGTIAYLLFSGRPPADDRQGLLDRLRRDDGLVLSATVDNIASELDDLVLQSTRPKVPERFQSVGEFLRQLDAVENELTRPANEVHENPTAAQVGQRFPQGWLVVNRLGQGSTAVVFLVERMEGQAKRQCVLKLALDPDKNATLQGEADVLKGLRHDAIVEYVDSLECAGHLGILLARAGEESMAHRIRKKRLDLEQLQRFGDDLLSALQYLEEQGVFHRDIKPDNLGIAPRGRGDYQHLVLFDFSLAKAPLAHTQVGTRGYLDPFLGQGGRRQYDPAAERYAAAVTLFEMATGKLPKWGDGKTAPELSDAEVDLADESLFPNAAREALGEFFRKALRRNSKQRFDNAEEMRRAWRRTFETLTAPAAKPEPASVTLQTSVQLLGLSTRALTVLERLSIDTVQQLLSVPQGRLTKGRGIGAVTRDELLRTLSSLRAQFPEIQPGDDLPERTKPPATDTETAASTGEDTPATLDQLADRILPVPRTKAKADLQHAQVLQSLLAPQATDAEPVPWPTQTEVARQHQTTTVAVHQVLAKARTRWCELGALSRIREALVPTLVAQGGIASLDEAVRTIGEGFGSGLEGTQRTRCARIVLRAAVEAEASADAPSFTIGRRQGAVWLVTNLDADGQTLDADALLRYAQDLGSKAAKLASAEPLPPPARVQEALQQVRAPSGMPPLNPERLVRLAAAAANVAVSGKLELYPRGMSAERALKLAHGALLGATHLTPAQVRERIHTRYPEAAPLPIAIDRLQELLLRVVPDLTWDAEQGAFRFQSAPKPQFTGERTLTPRVSTASQPPAESPEAIEAREFDVRLQKAHQKFLVLTARREDHETVLQRLQERFPGKVSVVSCERLFLEQLRRQTESEEIEWRQVLDADAAPPGSPHNTDLRQIVVEAAGKLGDLIGRGMPATTLLLTRLGVLARYGLLAQVVERLRERVYARAGTSGALSAVWLLVASPGTQERPTVDGVPIPVPGGRSDYVEVPRAWVQLGERGRAG